MTYVHSMDPFIFEFSNSGLGIRWYGMAYLTAFATAFFVVRYMAKKQTIALKVQQVGDFVTYVAIGIMVGGRLGYCLFYKPESLVQFTSEFPFWEVLSVHKGGMASHGGIMGIVVVCFWYGWKNKYSKLQLVDLASVVGGLGIFYGRMANFINGELFGRASSVGYKWAVKFPTELHYWANYKAHKLKLMTPFFDRLKGFQFQDMVVTSSQWLDLLSEYSYSSVARFKVSGIIDSIILATQEGNQKIITALEPVLTARYPSQIFQGLMEGLGVCLVCCLLWLTPKKPGVISGAFGITYSLMRILGEQYRMPDAHIGFDFLGLTRGQWLSVGLLTFAIGFLVVSLKQPTEPSGGFGFGKKK